jgi:hypothetical protein
MLRLLLLSSSLLLVHVLACQDSLTTDSRGHNPACWNPRYPYCVSGTCLQCNPYLGSDYVCDCPTNRVCQRDFTRGDIGTCISPPKYGDSCSGDSDCVTTFSDFNTFADLVCVSGRCRQCDPSGSQATPYTCDTGYTGEQRACLAPGEWGVPSAGYSTGGSTSSVSSTETTSSSSSSSSSGTASG